MTHQRRIVSGLAMMALLASTVAPAFAESGADNYPSLPTSPPVTFDDVIESGDLPTLFLVGVIALGGGRQIDIHWGTPPQGQYDPAGAARDRGEQPPPPPPATPTTAMTTTPEGQAAQQQLAGWKADLEKKIADPKASPQEKQIAQNKLAALNQFGAMQQADAGAAGAPGGR